jgi:hypothetical protein
VIEPQEAGGSRDGLKQQCYVIFHGSGSDSSPGLPWVPHVAAITGEAEPLSICLYGIFYPYKGYMEKPHIVAAAFQKD